MNAINTKDHHLIEGMLNNDVDAYRSAVKAYQKIMLHYAASIVGHAHAEDVVQTAWVQVIRSLKNYEGRSSLKNWILAIVKNGALTVLKKEKRNRNFSDLTGSQDIDYMEMNMDENNGWRIDSANNKWDLATPDALLESKELSTALDSTFNSLQSSSQKILKLRDADGMSIRNIGNALGLSETNVRVKLYRSRKIFRNIIKKYNSGENISKHFQDQPLTTNH